MKSHPETVATRKANHLLCWTFLLDVDIITWIGICKLMAAAITSALSKQGHFFGLQFPILSRTKKLNQCKSTMNYTATVNFLSFNEMTLDQTRPPCDDHHSRVYTFWLCTAALSRILHFRWSPAKRVPPQQREPRTGDAPPLSLRCAPGTPPAHKKYRKHLLQKEHKNPPVPHYTVYVYCVPCMNSIHIAVYSVHNMSKVTGNHSCTLQLATLGNPEFSHWFTCI